VKIEFIGTDPVNPEETGTHLSIPNKIAGLVSHKYAECCEELNQVPSNCEANKQTTILSHPIYINTLNIRAKFC